VENDWCKNVKKLTQHVNQNGSHHSLQGSTVQLSKKFARLVTKLLDKEMKKEQVRVCEVFMAIIATVPLPS
jgi:hypothetical protein